MKLKDFLIILIFIIIFNDLLVTEYGKDIDDCGTLDNPCLSLNYAIFKSYENETIYLLSIKESMILELPTLINKSIKIKGANEFKTNLILYHSFLIVSSNLTIEIENIHFKGSKKLTTFLILPDTSTKCKLIIKYCEFKNSVILFIYI
jgi:hypothetical protein